MNYYVCSEIVFFLGNYSKVNRCVEAVTSDQNRTIRIQINQKHSRALI